MYRAEFSYGIGMSLKGSLLLILAVDGFFCAIYKQLIAILPNRTKEEIRKCLESWGIEILSQVEEVSIDLFSAYKSLANELMPNADS
jgi:transposase